MEIADAWRVVVTYWWQSLLVVVFILVVVLVDENRRVCRKRQQDEKVQAEKAFSKKWAGFVLLQKYLAERNIPFVFSEEETDRYGERNIRGETKGDKLKAKLVCRRYKLSSEYEMVFELNNQSDVGNPTPTEWDALLKFHELFMMNALRPYGLANSGNVPPPSKGALPHNKTIRPEDLEVEAGTLYGILVRYEKLWDETELFRTLFVTASHNFEEDKKKVWEGMRRTVKELTDGKTTVVA